MVKILIVEDNQLINSLINEALSKQGVSCIQAFSGTEALLCLQIHEISLVLLDLMLPGMKGEDVLLEIRRKYNIPVIVVSAKDMIDTKVDLLMLGADDYITKPFEIRELSARVLVQLRRAESSEDKNVVKSKEMKLFRDSHKITVQDRELSLTKQEFKILELLLSNPNKVFTKQQMYEYAWDEYFIGEDKTINVHISNIRGKIKAFTDENYIETVWGIGFKLA